MTGSVWRCQVSAGFGILGIGQGPGRSPLEIPPLPFALHAAAGMAWQRLKFIHQTAVLYSKCGRASQEAEQAATNVMTHHDIPNRTRS